MKIYQTLTKKMKPTQICVGYAEVADKVNKLKKLNKNQLNKYLKENPLPAVAGPDGSMYLTDHHHLGRALLELGIPNCFFVVQHDFSSVPENKFFDVLKLLELVHPHDENGVFQDYKDIPKSLMELKDDPYRALAGFVRKAGGYQKVEKAYLEFQWADFFRDKFPVEVLKTKRGMKKSVVQGIKIAHSVESSHMLGWTGEIVVLEDNLTNKLKKPPMLAKDKVLARIESIKPLKSQKNITKPPQNY